MAVQLVRADNSTVTNVYSNLYTVPVGKQFVVSALYSNSAKTVNETFTIKIGAIETSCVLGTTGAGLTNDGFKGLVAQAGELLEIKATAAGPAQVMLSGELLDV